MSEDSITHGEDKENLLYIAQKIRLEEFTFADGDDHSYARESVISATQSYVSTEKIGSDVDVYNRVSKQIGNPNLFKDPEVLAKTKPFKLTWAYGIDGKVGIINLTIGDRKEIFFSTGHSPILYNYCSKQMRRLEGHQYLVTCMSADNSGRWLVTADNHADGVLIIWDSNDLKPVFTLFGTYPSSGILLLRLSGSARYLITIGLKEDGNYTVDFWLWTLGEEEPDDSFIADKSCNAPVAICFNPDIEEHIMIVFQDKVFLLIWDTEKKKFSKPVIPQITHKDKIGAHTGGTYLNSCHECYASSSKGCLLIFGNTLYAKPFEEGVLDNSKIFRNAIRVSPVSIECCTTIDGLLVTGDKRGFIFFFDRRVRILYWLRSYPLGPITSISFSSVEKFKYQDPSVVYIPKPQDTHIFECGFKDVTDEMDVIFNQDLPVDASLNKNAFIVKDFFVATTDCNIYAIDCLNDKCVPVFFVADACVSAMETHEEFSDSTIDESPSRKSGNYIIIGYANGRLMIMDYEKNEIICSAMLGKTDDENDSITCLKYCTESMHLVCGRENGEIWILEPILLTSRTETPFQPTKNKVVKIKFSTNSRQFAYYDTNRTVVIFFYKWDTGEWQCGGKIRSHYDEVNDIMFMPTNETSTLYSIGRDRYIVEYNNSKVDGEEELGIVSRERIEQSAIPMNFIYWFQVIEHNSYGYFVVIDDQHKMKFLYQASKIPKTIVLAPAFGCFKNQQIRKMKIIPHCDSRYMVFLTEKHIGLHIFPPDGSPYKYVGCLAHPIEVGDFVLSKDGNYIFTFGRNDHAVFKWQIIPRAVELMNILGGTELEAFYCLIEGGKRGWLFQEIKDLFYYMQILQQESIDMPRRVTDSIRLSELPDLIRTCGFYPTEFELENMMLDIKYRNFYETGKLSEEINFIDFVKLFCNHKPAYGYSKESVERSFKILVETEKKSNKAEDLTKEELVEALTTTGEAINRNTAHKYLKTLMRVTTDYHDYEFMPAEINFSTLYEDILGIDMSRSEILEFSKEEENLYEVFDRTELDY